MKDQFLKKINLVFHFVQLSKCQKNCIFSTDLPYPKKIISVLFYYKNDVF